MTQPAPDPYLDLPLDGVRLVEASAGTGKTYTLATLVTRLVVERGLRIGQVLAVTFTEAATQELRKRIRERLQLALALVDAAPADGESAEAALTRALLQRHRAASGEGDAALRRRLRQAAVEIDLAAIFTIHGFCARVLREHALEAGQGFDAPELLASDAELRNEVAADLWRQHAQTPEGADDLAALWKDGYEALAKDLPALLGGQALLPPRCAAAAGSAHPRAGRRSGAGRQLPRPRRRFPRCAARRAGGQGAQRPAATRLDWIEALWPVLAGLVRVRRFRRAAGRAHRTLRAGDAARQGQQGQGRAGAGLAAVRAGRAVPGRPACTWTNTARCAAPPCCTACATTPARAWPLLQARSAACRATTT